MRIVNRYVGPPAIVVEIRSPDETIAQQVAKCQVYAAHGVGITLLVVPEREVVRRFGSDGSDITLRGDDRIDLDAVLPGFQLTVRQHFDTLRD